MDGLGQWCLRYIWTDDFPGTQAWPPQRIKRTIQRYDQYHVNSGELRLASFVTSRIPSDGSLTARFMHQLVAVLINQVGYMNWPLRNDV